MKTYEACALLDTQLVKKQELRFVVRPGELEFAEITPEGATRRVVSPVVNDGLEPCRYGFEIPAKTTIEGFLLLLVQESGVRIVRVIYANGVCSDGTMNGIWCTNLEYSAKRICTFLYNAGRLKDTRTFLRLMGR